MSKQTIAQTDDLPQILVVQERTYALFGRIFICAYDEQGVGYLPFPHVCEGFGLEEMPQLAFMRRHYVLNDGLGVGRIKGKEIILIRLDAFALWLAMLPIAEMASTAIVEELIVLQECAAFVLQEGLLLGRLADSSILDWQKNENCASIQVYRQALQLMLLARENLHSIPMWNEAG